jgi:ferredoxin-thioredoxin reductase catalytic subunit
MVRMKASEIVPMMKSFASDLWRYRKETKKHDAWIRKYARLKGLSVNPHWMFYTNLKIWIAESEKTFGKRYCPCFEPGTDAEVNRKLICPCAYAAEEIEKTGTCHCVLFGKGELGEAGFKKAEARLMQEYRGTPLKLSGDVLDTRGAVMDPFRQLPIPDSLHQVKRALGKLKGKALKVLVAQATEAENLKHFADQRGLAFESKIDSGGLVVSLAPKP